MEIGNIAGNITGRKRHWLRVVIAAALASLPFAAGAQSCDPAPSGIVSWWSAEGNTQDNFGLNNGVFNGTPAYAPGMVGQAFNLDGASQYVRVPDSPSLRFSNGMSLEAWIYPTAYNTNQDSAIICKFGAFVVGQNSYDLYMSTDGTGAIIISTNGIGGAVNMFTTDVCPLNAWTHLAATYDGTNVNLYFNGVLENSTPLTGNIFPGTYDLGIGANINGNLASLFSGLIDEPTVYDRALSADEIEAIYNAGSAGKCPAPASIVVPPADLTLISGQTGSLTVGASGFQPLAYQWYFNGTNIPGATNTSLTLFNAQLSQAGPYFVTVSNAQTVQPLISDTVQVRVVLVAILGNNALLTNAQYSYSGSVTIKMTNYFTNGPIFYTLDGSTPTPGSTLYSGNFVLTTNAIIRALGYSSDFQQSALSGPVSIGFPPTYTFSASVAGGGGGSVGVSPSGLSFLGGTAITVTATPSNGWTFLQWNGDVSGNKLSNTLVIDRNESVQAVFGTTVGSTVGGSGSVAFDPPGGVYPFGTVLKVSAIPQAGNFFALWGSSASGNVNPLSFPVTNANSAISALFGSLSSGQVALAVVPVGPGTVAINPAENTYSTGSSVTITATPAANHTFVGWSGGASGTANPLNLQLNQSQTIYANFSTNAGLVISPVTRPSTVDGVAVDLIGQFGAHYRLDVSGDLMTWSNLYDLTNSVGTIHYLDTNASNFNDRYYRSEMIVP